jgi:hypothetical protein
MQGFIHLLLEAYVSETIGSQHLRQIRRIAGIQGPPLAAQHYPDEVTTQLLGAISEYESIAMDDLLYQFGVYFMQAPLMHQHYRIFLEGHTSARQFLEQVPAVHRHLKSAIHAVSLPDLHLIDHAPDLLEIIYDSPRHLCRFLKGVLEGVGQYFHETLEVSEMACQQRGALACRILVRFSPVQLAGPAADYLAQGSAGLPLSLKPGGAPPSRPLSPAMTTVELQARRQRDEDEDVLILYALASSQTDANVQFKPGDGQELPPYLALSLFEIAYWLTGHGVSAEYTRLSLLQRSLTRLAVQGMVESKLDVQPTRQNAPSSAAALGGQGILASRRYRITAAGQTWLRDMQHRQDY